MHIRPLAKALLLSLTLLTTPSLLHAQDKKPEKEEEKAQPKFIGLWESPEEGFYVEFLADGVMNMISPDDMSASGTWKVKKENEALDIKLEKDGEKMEAVMGMKFDGDDKVTLTVEGDPLSFVRVKGTLKAESFIGTWKGTDDDKEMGTLSHYLTIMKKGGKGVSKSMEIYHKKKIYCVSEWEFTWRVVGNRLIETYDAGTEDEGTTIYAVKFLNPDKARLKIIGLDEEGFDEERTKDTDLPKPPKGYKKLTEDEYWEIMDEIYEEEE